MPNAKKEWVLEMSVQSFLKVTEEFDDSNIHIFEMPALLIFVTNANEYSVEGFKTLEEAKDYMEKKFDATEGSSLDGVFFYGKEMEWKEVHSFDFRERKTERRE